ncbi:MAG: alpha-L-fucosidase C-terminal domain-containing protein [Eubacteriales bacterium]
MPWNSSDFRFTSKGKNVYAFMMRTPENNAAVIKSFREDEKVTEVILLGYGQVPFSQNFGILTVKLPNRMPTEYSNCLKITLA